MGKPYQSEIRALPATYDWAVQADASPLKSTVAALSGLPLLTVGSGGSYTCADYIASLHQAWTGRMARAVTPLEVLQGSTADPRGIGVCLVSAGGRNPDVLAAASALLEAEPAHLAIVTGTPGSPLAELVRGRPGVHLVELTLPVRKDGFLATNSLLAFATLLYRAYGGDENDDLPKDLSALLGCAAQDQFVADLRRSCADLWSREILSVLFGTASRAGAIDLESKFTEAALGSLQLADYRNFAHGRHHWFAKHGDRTAILAITTPDDEDIADRTLRLLPSDIAIARLSISHHGPVAGLASIAAAMHVAALAGEARGIDPGKPGVPSFGSRLYNLSPPKSRASRAADVRQAVAVERKTRLPAGALQVEGLDRWREAYLAFTQQLSEQRFPVVVFDYDGTLCAPGRKARYEGLGKAAAKVVVDLARAGVVIGIATGRGKSVQRDLAPAVPAELHSLVWMGYYNGGIIKRLDDELRDDEAHRSNPDFDAVWGMLSADPTIARYASPERRFCQLTVELKDMRFECSVWDSVQDLLARSRCAGVQAVRSSHSIDVLATGVSKLTLVQRVTELAGGPPLCIGDRGRWPGNDFLLLGQPHALSVDEVSPATTTCWNLTSAGNRNVEGLLEYASWFSAQAGAVRVRLPKPAKKKSRSSSRKS